MTSLPTTDPRRAYFLLAHEVFQFCRERILVSGIISTRFLNSRPLKDLITRPSSRIVARTDLAGSSTNPSAFR